MPPIACRNRHLGFATFVNGRRLQHYVVEVRVATIVEVSTGYIDGVSVCGNGCGTSQKVRTVAPVEYLSTPGVCCSFAVLTHYKQCPSWVSQQKGLERESSNVQSRRAGMREYIRCWAEDECGGPQACVYTPVVGAAFVFWTTRPHVR